MPTKNNLQVNKIEAPLSKLQTARVPEQTIIKEQQNNCYAYLHTRFVQITRVRKRLQYFHRLPFYAHNPSLYLYRTEGSQRLVRKTFNS